jgi:hypothetical protein
MWTRGRQVRAWGAVMLVGLVLVGCAAMTAKVKSSLLADSVLGATAIDVDTNAGWS